MGTGFDLVDIPRARRDQPNQSPGKKETKPGEEESGKERKEGKEGKEEIDEIDPFTSPSGSSEMSSFYKLKIDVLHHYVLLDVHTDFEDERESNQIDTYQIFDSM